MRFPLLQRTGRPVVAAVWLLALVLFGCVRTAEPPIAENRPVAYVDPDGSHESMAIDTLYNRNPHLRFADGQISLNDRCPVRRVPLNVRLPGLYVNGKPIGFC